MQQKLFALRGLFNGSDNVCHVCLRLAWDDAEPRRYVHFRHGGAGASGRVRAGGDDAAPWAFAGGDISDSHAVMTSATDNPNQLNKHTAAKLALKWTYPIAGAVSSTPTVEAGGLYATDAFGWIYKINPDTGALIWKNLMSKYTGNASSGSRNSPAIGADGEIVFGDGVAATVVAINRTTGKLMWQTTVDTNPYAYITGSAVIYKGLVYIGVSSGEEYAAQSDPGYQPVFRGSVVALDEKTGKIVWQFHTVPVGYAGGSVWGSSPVVFKPANALIFSTGNNYAVPTAVATCVGKAGSSISAQLACMDPDNMVDAVVSVDLKTGALNWSRRLEGSDIWTANCVGSGSGCEKPAGIDADFASMPNLVFNKSFVGVSDDRGGVSNQYILGAGQKAGTYWRLNPFNGGLFGYTFVGMGDIKYGSAVDLSTNAHVLVALEDSGHFPNMLAGQHGKTVNWNAGSWGEIDLTTGKFDWQIPANGQDLSNPAYGGTAGGSVAYSNNVLFAESTSGYMTAVDADSGNILWTYASGQPVNYGPAVFNEMVYWGTARAHGSKVSAMIYAFGVK